MFELETLHLNITVVTGRILRVPVSLRLLLLVSAPLVV